ncbi:MAG: CvpA family protein [Desulfobacula sp.]|nr:CvpA family protein [Desulfobacula sp.]
MNTFDIVVIVVISFCLIRGLFKGLVGEVSGIIGVVAGFYGAFTYYPMIAVYAEPWIESSGIRSLLAFFLLFCIILSFVGLISILIRKLLKLVFLGWVDRTFGLVFGAAKGVLIMSVLFIMVTTFLPRNSSILKESICSPYLAQVSKTLTVFISKNGKSGFLNNLEGLF